MEKLKLYLKLHKISQHQFAQMLGLTSQGSISRWFLRGRIPAQRVLQVERLTNGIVKRHDLRPDLYPRE